MQNRRLKYTFKYILLLSLIAAFILPNFEIFATTSTEERESLEKELKGVNERLIELKEKQ